MNIITRYYIREFLGMLGVVAFGIAMVFSLLDLVNKIDNFAEGNLSVIRIAEYAILNLPKFLYYLLPMSMLICSLFIFSQASRNKELVAVKATGGRLKILFTPFIVIGLLMSLCGFLIGEVIIPYFSERSLEFRMTYMKKDDKVSFKEGTLWLRDTGGRLVRIGLYEPEKGIAKGVSIFTTGNGSLRGRTEAGEAVWVPEKGVWTLNDVVTYDFAEGRITKTPQMIYPHLESPEFFGKWIKSPEEMGLEELYRYTKKLEAAGIRDVKLSVDMNSKISYPLAIFFMMLLGMSLSVLSGVGGGLMAAGFGIAISFVYWLLYTLTLSMGYARVIPPVLATWSIPVLSGILAVYLFRKIPE
ncbi:MAG: LPS export ABC transporter permease LptG [Nitrospirota bacterium]